MTTTAERAAASKLIPLHTLPLPVTVELIGQDGNAYNILGLVKRAMQKEGYGDLFPAFWAEATAGSYDELLGVCMKWVDVQ